MNVTTAYNAVTIQIYFIITNENASEMVHSNRILGQFPIKGSLRIVDVLVYIRLYIVLYMFCMVTTCLWSVMFYYSLDGTDLCFEVVRRASAGFVYSEAVAR